MIVLIVIIFVFFAIISLLFLFGWHSTRDKNMLGGVIVLAVTLVIFLLVLILADRKYRQEHPVVSTLSEPPLIQNN
jgi:hypothetical protein